ncbi:MAG: methyltransferase domain-containing protein [Bacteroidetes bacterium]|nr:methyltransferase domain-containing protein [Bacteroidota bacterium]
MDYKIKSQTYEILYARYLNPYRVVEMVDLAGDLKGKVVADLCCGGGRLTREILKRNPARVFSVDESLDMLENNFKLGDITIISSVTAPWNTEEYKCACGKIEFALLDLKSDVIFCQQAVNYWFNTLCVKLIKNALTPKGLFIFNTFHNKPSVTPTVKTYKMKHKEYTEISWLVGDRVKHVQVVEGMDPHFTEFRWIPPKEFRDSFKKNGFKVTVIKSGGTDIYVCKKL